MTKYSRYKEVAIPAGLLASLVVGAGMFALPFVFYEAGVLVGALYLALFAVVFATVHRMYAEIIEHTPGRHRFVGFAEIYLGRGGFWAGTATTVVGFMLTLTIYIILAGSFIEIVFPLTSGGASSFLFWLAGSAAIALSVRRLAKTEFFVTLGIGAIVLALFGAGLLRGDGVPLPLVGASGFLPYGVVLFSLAGRAAISSVWEYYERQKLPRTHLPRAIRIGSVLPAFLYLFFAVGVILLSSGSVSPDALSGLVGLPLPLLVLAAGLGILALFTSYFLLGTEIRDIIQLDLTARPRTALLSVVLFPILLYLFGLQNFIALVGVVGGVFLAAESAMVVLMYGRMRRWSAWGALIVLLFALGALYEIYQFV